MLPWPIVLSLDDHPEGTRRKRDSDQGQGHFFSHFTTQREPGNRREDYRRTRLPQNKGNQGPEQN